MGDDNATETPRKRKPRGRPFEKGNKASPGRTKGTKNKSTVLLDEIGLGAATGLLKAAIRDAEAGDKRDREFILRTFIPQRRGRLVNFELPSVNSIEDAQVAFAAIMRAVAEGHITIEECASLTQIVEAQCRLYQTMLNANAQPGEGEAPKRVVVIEGGLPYDPQRPDDEVKTIEGTSTELSPIDPSKRVLN